MPASRATRVGSLQFQYPTDIVCVDETHFYVCDMVAPGKNTVVYEVTIPGAPEDVSSASMSVVGSGYWNGWTLAYARSAGALAISEFGGGETGTNSGSTGNSGAKVTYVIGSGAGASGLLIFQDPTHPYGPTFPNTDPNSNSFGNWVHQVSGIALSSNAGILYGIELRGRVVDDYPMENIWSCTGTGGKDVVVRGAGGFSGGYYGEFGGGGYLRISEDDQYLFHCSGLGSIMRVYLANTPYVGTSPQDNSTTNVNTQPGFVHWGPASNGLGIPPVRDASFPIPLSNTPVMSNLNAAIGFGKIHEPFRDPTLMGVPAGSSFPFGYGAQFPWRGIGTSNTAGVVPGLYNLKGACQTASGSTYVVCGDGGQGSFGTAQNPGTLWRLGGYYDPPADAHSVDTLSGSLSYPQQKPFVELDGINLGILSDDYPPHPLA